MKRRMDMVLAVCCAAGGILLPPFGYSGALAQPLAFPGAEGFGASTSGGRGGDVYHVTSLADAGDGSLRFGITSAAGPRTIVFDVSGTVALQSDLTLDKPNITIAGQTAPGGGITLRNFSLSIADTSQVVVRYIRSRPGDAHAIGANDVGDALSIYNSTNVIIDHVSTSWDLDETLSVTGASDNVTVQWSIISESLTARTLPSGQVIGHGAGSLIQVGEGGVTYHHNLYAHDRKRNPSVTSYPGHDGITLDFRNNVVYDWGVLAGHSGEGWPADGVHPKAFINLVSNYFKTGPSTDSGHRDEIYYSDYGQDDAIYVKGNYLSSHPTWIIDSRQDDMIAGPDLWTQLASPLAAPAVSTDSYLTAYNRVLAGAGASLNRDAIDVRVTNDVKNGTGHLIYSQDEVGGWPALSALAPPVDTDRDGMPNLWESDRNLSPFDASDRNSDRDADGYTNLEEYLHWRTLGNAVAGAEVGDADFDGDVDLSDLGILASHYGALGGTTWTVGDFDFDNDVDLADLGALASHYGAGPAQALADFQTLIPEPGSASIFAMCSAALFFLTTLVRRRRHRPTLKSLN